MVRGLRSRRGPDGHLGAGEVADIGVELVGEGARGEVLGRVAAVGVEALVAEGVELSGDSGAHAPRAEHCAVVLGRGRQRGARDPRPLPGQRAEEQGDEVDLVDTDTARRQAVEGGVNTEADDPDLSVLVDQDVLGSQATVRQTRGVRLGDAVGHLRDQHRGAPGSQRTLADQEVVERLAAAPLVDDVAAPVLDVGVEDAQQPAIGDRSGRPGGAEQRLGAVVVGLQDVDRDGSVQHLVVGAPEASAPRLGEQVVEAVAVGEDVTGLHGPGHGSPHPHVFVDPDVLSPS